MDFLQVKGSRSSYLILTEEHQSTERRVPGAPCERIASRWPHRRWLAAPQVEQVLADYFPVLSHNDPRSLPSNHRPGTSSSRRLPSGGCEHRPKHHVTPFPGRFCRELLCYHDFAAQPSPQTQENKEFVYKIGVGVPVVPALPSYQDKRTGGSRGLQPPGRERICLAFRPGPMPA